MEIILTVLLLILCLFAIGTAAYFFKKFQDQKNQYKALNKQYQVLLAEYKSLQDAQEQLKNSEKYLKTI